MTFSIIGTAMLISLLCGISLGLMWPIPQHPGVDLDSTHPLYGPLGPIVENEALR